MSNFQRYWSSRANILVGTEADVVKVGSLNSGKADAQNLWFLKIIKNTSVFANRSIAFRFEQAFKRFFRTLFCLSLSLSLSPLVLSFPTNSVVFLDCFSLSQSLSLPLSVYLSHYFTYSGTLSVKQNFNTFHVLLRGKRNTFTRKRMASKEFNNTKQYQTNGH